MDIQGTVALVTGANRGVGFALVQALLDRGAAKVYAAARRDAGLSRVMALDTKRIMPVCLDVTDSAQLARVAAQANAVRILFNNAGVLDSGSVLDAPAAAFKRNFDVNFFGMLHATRAFAPALMRQSGAVVNILTVAVFASMPGLGVYSASKTAAWSLTQSLRADLSKKHVKVFSVFPGPVDTDMAKGVDIPKAAPHAVAMEVLKGIESNTEDIFPDPMSMQIYPQWASDHKRIEHDFAAM
jgi:NAD(P)-dependent dehydrogenase (short-subunit alcohol dehydrogenase family)